MTKLINICDHLKKFIEHHNYTQEDFAKICKVRQQTIQKIICGKTQEPSFYIIYRLVVHFHITFDDFLCWKPSKGCLIDPKKSNGVDIEVIKKALKAYNETDLTVNQIDVKFCLTRGTLRYYLYKHSIQLRHPGKVK